jgi:hypothetical protein
MNYVHGIVYGNGQNFDGGKWTKIGFLEVDDNTIRF